jgi:Na+/H+ antiporter NhaD/arsenite permease-like protein
MFNLRFTTLGFDFSKPLKQRLTALAVIPACLHFATSEKPRKLPVFKVNSNAEWKKVIFLYGDARKKV